jgi:hypothetical protein
MPGCTSSASSSARCTRGRQRGADRADAGRAARAAGRGACQERARQLGRRGRRAGFAGVLIKLVGAPLALLVNAVLLLGSALILRGIRVHEARPAPHAATRTSGATCGRPALRRRAPAAGDAGGAGGRLADVPLRRDRGADPVRHAHARPVRAGGRPVLHGHGRRHHRRQRARPPHQPAARPRALPGAGLRVCGAAGCCWRWRRPAPGAWRCSR